MTASSVEFFPCRVQLMGLPRSAAATAAASVNRASESSAPVGSAAVNVEQQTALNALSSAVTGVVRGPPPPALPTPPPSASPSPAKVRSVSRNLFGATNADDIDRLMQNEMQRQRHYVLQRYNFDIQTGRPAADSVEVVGLDRSPPPSPPVVHRSHTANCLPALIAAEMRQHEQRRRINDKSNGLNGTSDNDEDEVDEDDLERYDSHNGNKDERNDYDNMLKDHNDEIEKVARRSYAPESLNSLPAQLHYNIESGVKTSSKYRKSNCLQLKGGKTAKLIKDKEENGHMISERYTPYKRQSLITDSYSVRKNKSHFSEGGIKSLGAVSLKLRQLEQEQRQQQQQQQQKQSRCITEVLKQVKKQQKKQKPVLEDGIVSPQQNHQHIHQQLNSLPVLPAETPSFSSSDSSEILAETNALSTGSTTTETEAVIATLPTPATTLLLKVSVSSQRRTSTEQAPPPSSHHT